MIESMWMHYNPPVSPTNMNLDDMFGFLQAEMGTSKDRQDALSKINAEFEILDELLDSDMVSLI